MPAGNILVADDDSAIRTVLNQALSRAGYEVRSTGNAATLWRWVSQGDGDLVITDVVMPDESAFDLLPRDRCLVELRDEKAPEKSGVFVPDRTLRELRKKDLLAVQDVAEVLFALPLREHGAQGLGS